MKGSLQCRIAIVAALLVSGLSLLSLRLVQVQVADHQHYLDEARQIHTFKRAVPARRGDIFDCRGNLLATTVPLKKVMADLHKMRQILERNRKQSKRDGRSRITEPWQIAAQLAPVLGLEPAAVIERLQGRGDLVAVQPKVTLETWRKIEALGLPGVEATDQFQRVYPGGRLGSHVIGYVDGDGAGRGGIEASMQDYLCGVDGWYQSQKDALLREIRMYRSQDAPPKHGLTVVLTLDETIQHIVEEELDAAMAANGARGACAIAMRPATGEILALANRPTFDANELGASDWDNIRNRCVTDAFEPGSTFKIVTLAAALECGRVTLETPIFCENGRFDYEGYTLHDPGTYGMLTVLQALQKSSNIAFAKLGIQVGARDLYHYVRGFGFGTELLEGILPGESPGRVAPPERWTKLSATRVPIGYEVAVTPLQVVAAISAVANRGVWMRPLLVDRVIDAQGNAVARFAARPVRQVIRSETADRVVEALEAVVSEHGTAKRAIVEGFTVAGKTGTSKKWDAQRHEYSDRRYLASFAGMVPSHDPAFVLLVMIDEPQGEAYYGGLVAAPVFSAMAARIARHLDIDPQGRELEVVRR